MVAVVKDVAASSEASETKNEAKGLQLDDDQANTLKPGRMYVAPV